MSDEPVRVVCQRWVESEKGRGSRSGGISLHHSFSDLGNYVAAHWQSMPALIPDEYSRPDGSPWEMWVGVEVADKISGFGLRVCDVQTAREISAVGFTDRLVGER